MSGITWLTQQLLIMIIIMIMIIIVVIIMIIIITMVVAGVGLRVRALSVAPSVQQPSLTLGSRDNTAVAVVDTSTGRGGCTNCRETRRAK